MFAAPELMTSLEPLAKLERKIAEVTLLPVSHGQVSAPHCELHCQLNRELQLLTDSA